MRIRPYHPDDHETLYEICLRTGASGQDATALYADPRLLGHVYVGPYLRLEPELAFVVADELGPAGYVLGARDTAAFEATCERLWWPPLRQRYPEGAFPEGSGDARLVALMNRPHRTPAPVTGDYPAHLHVDLLPRTQGQGYGRRLLETLFDALRRLDVAGVHLGVGARNERAIGFYQRMGFRTLSRSDQGLVMGRTMT